MPLLRRGANTDKKHMNLVRNRADASVTGLGDTFTASTGDDRPEAGPPPERSHPSRSAPTFQQIPKQRSDSGGTRQTARQYSPRPILAGDRRRRLGRQSPVPVTVRNRRAVKTFPLAAQSGIQSSCYEAAR